MKLILLANLLCFSFIISSEDSKCDVDIKKRKDCGYYGITKEKCLSRGCCVEQTSEIWCFYSKEEEIEEDDKETKENVEDEYEEEEEEGEEKEEKEINKRISEIDKIIEENISKKNKKMTRNKNLSDNNMLQKIVEGKLQYMNKPINANKKIIKMRNQNGLYLPILLMSILVFRKKIKIVTYIKIKI